LFSLFFILEWRYLFHKGYFNAMGIFSIEAVVILRAVLHALKSSEHFVFYTSALLPCTLKTASMDNIKTLELEILIVVRQNRRVPTHHFYKLFEHRWNSYNAKFNELAADGLFETVAISGIPIYELTGKGRVRITELLEQRERDITVRLLHLKQIKPIPAGGWKSPMTFLSSLVKLRVSSQTTIDSEPQIANKV
jgi:hypothetical protein